MSTAQWANIGEDAGALHALIARISEHVAVATIDYLWIFPPRRIAIGESVVVVVAAFDDDPARRRVSTAHFTVARNRKGVPSVVLRFAEHGSAPVNAVPRIVEGVLRRLGEDTEAAPRDERIEGDRERWDALIVDLGGRVQDPTDDSAAGDGDADIRPDTGPGDDSPAAAHTAAAHDPAADGEAVAGGDESSAASDR